MKEHIIKRPEIDNYINEFIKKSSFNILVLTGARGTGKTTYLRYLLELYK